MMRQQSVRQAARRSALDAQAGTAQVNVPIGYAGSRGLAVAVLTALGERDGAVRDTERRAGDALQTMTSEEGLSLRQAVEWWAVAPLRCGRCLGYGNSRATRQAAAADERATHPPALAIRQPSERPPWSALRPPALHCAQRPGLGGAEAFTCRAATDTARGG